MPSDKQIINTYDQLIAAREKGLPDVAIMPKHEWSGRSQYRAGWKVYRPGSNLNIAKNPRWGEECRQFEEFGMTRREAFAEAAAWAGKQYKIVRFARNRVGDYVDHRVNATFPLPKRERRKTDAK